YGDKKQEWAPIVSVMSVGSIGTVGHKTRDSDLDLQVMYDFHPFVYDTAEWNDQILKEALNKEHKWWINALRKQQKISIEDVRKPEVQKKLSSVAAGKVAKTYPGLYRYLVEENKEFATQLFRSTDKTLRIQVLHEMLNLMKRREKIAMISEYKEKETLLKQRLDLVQDYLTKKFPDAEIYLFVYSADSFRHGSFSSTLEFKESSGSAYEMILNYDVLMPSIQFTPVVPTHFIFPQAINNDTFLFNRLVDYMRFGALETFKAHHRVLVDLGPTPNLSQKYVAEHGGAIYWEAFKASSGNLPKAIMNLFRIEMLLDKRMNKTIIQLIKDPGSINKMVSPKPKPQALNQPKAKSSLSIIQRAKAASQGMSLDELQQSVEDQLEGMANLKTGMPTWLVMEFEEKFAELNIDPWWIRYKALKIGFCEPHGVLGVEMEERHRISKVLDLSFCLHLRISDVLETADGAAKKSYRDQFLTEFLEKTFPPGSARRINLESLFHGGVRGLIFFENEMRDLFQKCMARVEGKMAQMGVQEHAGSSQEVELWLNYYVQNFQPLDHVVPRVIMKHLKVARDGIEISMRPEGWVFMSILRKDSLLDMLKAKRKVQYLPERILLLEKAEFLKGLAHCILNGYFGLVKKGTPEERPTDLVLDLTKVDQQQNVHNDFAFLTQNQIRDITRRIAGFFSYQPYNFVDIIYKPRRITGLYVFLNLWRYGRLSALYRDNMNVWYCEEWDLKEMFLEATEISKDMRKLLGHKSIHECLKQLFKKRHINLEETEIVAWANPNSLIPDRSMGFQGKLKDMEEGTTFVEIILKHWIRDNIGPGGQQAAS
ncbi:MAG: hypothetical protein OEZ59_07435, partial [Deltaproteobacteria bacterium]|nr:hypothetical protein [Deltaproteobacteria bacterium]